MRAPKSVEIKTLKNKASGDFRMQGVGVGYWVECLGGVCWVECVGWSVLGGVCWVECVGWRVLGIEM